MNIIFCCSYIGLKNLKHINSEEKSIYLTHNKKIKKILQRQNKQVILTYSLLPNNRITKPLVIFSYVLYYFIGKFFSLILKNQKIYHDIQGYAISEYILIQQLSRNNLIYSYTNVNIDSFLDDDDCYLKWYDFFFNVKIVRKKYNDETFYYFPVITGKKISLNNNLVNSSDNKFDNTIFLYVGGIVESKLMGSVDYDHLLETISKALRSYRVCVKHHPRFKKFDFNKRYTSNWEIASDEEPAENIVGNNCIGVGFQTIALCNTKLKYSISLIELSNKKNQVLAYKTYLNNNSQEITFHKNLDEFHRFIEQLPEMFHNKQDFIV